MAGCVPLYWGDDDTNTDFVNGSVVNLSMFNSPEQILDIVKKLELNPDLCSKIASTPILNEEKKVDALKQLSKMSHKLLSIACDENKNIPFTLNVNLKNIDKVFIINLDTRKDRWDTLCKEEPFITSIAERVSAVNGRTLKLTPYIYSLFKNNNFNWKKSVMGCSLSHLNIWTKILSQKSGNLFLILEDDVRFIETQLSTWNKYAETIPEDAELIYIGGVLPPNRAGLESVIGPINDFWARVKPNRLFTNGQLIPLFHFCTYSYIISRKGVEKLIAHLINSVDKMSCAVDHFLGYNSLKFNTYVANPLITKCFQDDDAAYLNAEFNSTGSIAAFDSDISNNTECFNKEELDTFRPSKNQDKTVTLYHLSDNINEIYEHSWTADVFSEYTLKSVKNINEFIENGAWFLVQRPYLDIFNTYFKNLPLDCNFKVLHLSDEFGRDNIDFYNLPNCKGIIRNYLRLDTPLLPHIIMVPLGYHHKGTNAKTFSDRKLVWSFHGNSWFDRKSQLENLYSIAPHNCFFIDEWNAPNMTKQDQYISTLANSKFCPILRGNNIETFRLYEALEVGTIPIYVRQLGDDAYWLILSSKLELISIETWDKAKNIIQYFLDNPDAAEKYRVKLYTNWIQWKTDIKSVCKNII
jgi:GR25 family glycosyltransferase involved in LPS biosynthesis